jgi:hypothetical protein
MTLTRGTPWTKGKKASSCPWSPTHFSEEAAKRALTLLGAEHWN